MAKAKKVLLDTNFLLIPGQFGVDVFSELEKVCDFPYKLNILEESLKELENIQEMGKGADKSAAKLALQLIKAQQINIITSESGLYADDQIVEIADSDWVVCTQDSELKKRLKDKNVRVLTLRQKKYLRYA